MAAAWWEAAAEAGSRAPTSFPPAAWIYMHAVLAAVWHDLCADAIIIPPAPDLKTSLRTDEPSGRRLKTHTAPHRILLPPVRAQPAIWADAADRAALARATAGGHGYRRLPQDWQQRRDRPDFQHRQAAAAQRAIDHGYPPPPPGFTYVRPFMRGLVHGEPLRQLDQVTVRSRGLFTLLLGLQPLAADAVVDEA
jgi:hypothetical protein